jgi:hypothetical protein
MYRDRRRIRAIKSLLKLLAYRPLTKRAAEGVSHDRRHFRQSHPIASVGPALSSQTSSRPIDAIFARRPVKGRVRRASTCSRWLGRPVPSCRPFRVLDPFSRTLDPAFGSIAPVPGPKSVSCEPPWLNASGSVIT